MRWGWPAARRAVGSGLAVALVAVGAVAADRAHLLLLFSVGLLASVAAVQTELARRYRAGESGRRRELEAAREARRALERRLGESETCLRRLWESNIIGMTHSTGEGVIRDANDFVLQMLGVTREDVLSGRAHWRDLTPAEYLPLDERGIAEALERGVCTPYEKVYVTGDGRRVPALIGFALLEGSRTDFICFLLDLTEQKRAEAALAEQITKSITDNASAALFILDERGVCIFMNPAAEPMIGWSLAELEGAPFHATVHRHGAGTRCMIERALSQEGRLEACEDVYVRRGGEAFPVLCSSSRIVRPGRPPQVLLEVRDVTEQARAAAEREMLLESERAARCEAERASRLKDDFVATLSHELRTPLNAVLGFSRLCRRPGQTPEQLDKGLDTIERNAHLLGHIISDLLDVSSMVTGKLRVDLAQVELGPVVEAALGGMRAAAEAKEVVLVAALGAPSGLVHGDGPRLSQVVWNLVSNAIKFTPRGGRVDVSLTRRGERFVLEVSDTGQGIEPAFLPFVFERFRQAEASASRRHGGLGLGLSIVKHLVDVHGGEVRVESDGAGHGARFTVELPASAEVVVPVASAAPPLDPPRLSGARVLVVDDEPDAKDLVRRLLEEQGALVVTAGSAAEALDMLAEGPVDVMVSDIGMPGMDGYELIRRVRAGSAARDLPAVALTAYARSEDRARVLCAGYQAHLTKPVEPRELLATVGRLACGERVTARAG